MDPENLHTCLMCPFRTLKEWGGGGFAGNVTSLKTQISQKEQISGEKKCKRLSRGRLNTCAKVQGLSLKNGVDIGL